MPVYKTITIDETSRLQIWKVEESLVELSSGIELSDYCKERFEAMKSEIHQRAFMSIRHLLQNFGYTDFDLEYDDNGKPHLKDGKHISISHSYNFTVVIVSDRKVGVDIEKQREKIKRIAPKFTPIEEYRSLGRKDLIKKLTIVWGAKESLYKLFGKQGLLFLHDIYVVDFDFKASTTDAEVTYQGLKKHYHLKFYEIEDFICVYAIEPKLN
ncbi:4'-phosphopantetheinyl transferase family protein [Mesohalobacter halotolerans]|uniref:4'-phosphopantetheinyl transferase superfamily protein n=1 Tax=Mesohalobacter halotolerans TaxID=1883405 RepID=A0A4U5TUF3_9FLAO|nr:4'-phosphopantetheinyl transferase superfamily protein [Mesohalobacter halotolerans]TKS56928.1 4'-phosphopantetheinyl transferase superfamily protein [Mesohalobacter halotolerans]